MDRRGRLDPVRQRQLQPVQPRPRAAVLSEDLTRITDPKTGDNYTLAWYDDRSGFVWEDHGDFIRDDSKIGKSAVERWEATCGVDWLG